MLSKKDILLPFIVSVSTMGCISSGVECNNGTIVAQSSYDVNTLDRQIANATKKELLSALCTDREGQQPNGDIVKCVNTALGEEEVLTLARHGQEGKRPYVTYTFTGTEWLACSRGVTHPK